MVLTDLKMPFMSGVSLLEEVLKDHPGSCVLIMTAHGTIDNAVEAMRKGAFDYLTKPLEREELLLVLERAIERAALVRENRMLHEQLKERYRVTSLVGTSGKMEEVYRLVTKVALSNATVLIYGESGTGKELVAKAIHMESGRSDLSFFAVNVAALPETLLEAELFGHEKGAFTGADAQKVGLIEQAEGSTLFLDEVGDLRKDLQVKLLRVLQECEITRVGGRDRIRVNARFIAATNQDLERAVREGRFREDLYYRLNVIPISLPPLRDRRTDIPALVDHFLKKYGSHVRKNVRREALDALTNYDWPGNVRQLESVIERALLLGEGEVILPKDLPATIQTFAPSTTRYPGIHIPDTGFDLESVERDLILEALDKSGGNVSKAARLPGLTRRKLQYRLEKKKTAPTGSPTPLQQPVFRVSESRPPA